MAYDPWTYAYTPPAPADQTYLHGRGQPGGYIPGYNPTPPPMLHSPMSPFGLGSWGSLLMPPLPDTGASRGDILAQRKLDLARISAALLAIPKQVGLANQRLATDQGLDVQRTNEAASARGLASSSIRSGGVYQVGQQYSRQRQDIATQAQQQTSALQAQKQQALLNAQQSLHGLDTSSAAAQNSALANWAGGPGGSLVDMAIRAANQLGLPASWATSPDLWSIVQHESGGNPNAQNPNSTAYGLFQFLNGTWAGTGYQKTSDPWTQMLAGLTYIKNRYGSPQNAWSFWQNHNWY